ncbi:MAG: bacteriocin transport accessory protein [Butyrivibrio sp.]|nr:bacteriocin transport accessory protein [Acetatifactor muris]MCM1561358.1 bacteriocin transport accessory protein [Butyrivibrio sp.]
MKRFLAMLLTVFMVSALAACGGQEGAGGEGEEIADSLTLLNRIWDSYEEDDKFPAMGGDFSEENMVDGGPGNYGLEDTAMLDYSLGLPEASASLIDGAASLTHMMNANTFTCAAFHVSNSDNVSAVADALRENILQRQWMCGFPDKLLVITVGDYVISAFGNEELIDTLKTKAAAAYDSAKVVYEEPVI